MAQHSPRDGAAETKVEEAQAAVCCVSWDNICCLFVTTYVVPL